MITINIYYSGEDVMEFANEMTERGIVEAIRNEPGNLKYQYYVPFDGDGKTILLIDQWEDQKALDIHHGLPLMEEIIKLRNKYDLKMRVQRFEEEKSPEKDQKYIR